MRRRPTSRASSRRRGAAAFFKPLPRQELAAQALIEGIPVITGGPVFKHFRVKVLW